MSDYNVVPPQQSLPRKRKSLGDDQKKWIREKLLANPEKWRLSHLAASFEHTFPVYGEKYLTQHHIDRQRKNIRDANRDSDDEETEKRKTIKSSVSKVQNINHVIYHASHALANQAIYFVDLLDERGRRDERNQSNDKPKTNPVGLIKPNALSEDELLANTEEIETATDDLVTLLIRRREHEATKIDNTENEEKSTFVGFVVEKRPNKRSYHIMAGTNSEIDPIAVKLLSALYATQPLTGNNKKPKVIIKTKRDCTVRTQKKALDQI